MLRVSKQPASRDESISGVGGRGGIHVEGRRGAQQLILWRCGGLWCSEGDGCGRAKAASGMPPRCAPLPQINRKPVWRAGESRLPSEQFHNPPKWHTVRMANANHFWGSLSLVTKLPISQACVCITGQPMWIGWSFWPIPIVIFKWAGVPLANFLDRKSVV